MELLLLVLLLVVVVMVMVVYNPQLAKFLKNLEKGRVTLLANYQSINEKLKKLCYKTL